MKATILAPAIAGAASTQNIALLARRQDPSGIRPDLIDDASEECKEAFSPINDSLPDQPTEVLEFSSEFYETATRTATVTYADCEWVTSIPTELYTPMLEWADDLLDWAHDEDNQDLAEDAAEVCEDILGREEPCHYEWESFWRSASASTGWELGETEADNDDGEDDDSGASTVTLSTFATAAALAAFIGYSVLL